SNKVVTPNDLVIHLGDIMTYKNNLEDLQSYVPRLNGTKIIVRGNHDENYSDKDLLSVFSHVQSDPFAFEYHGHEFWLCHYPVQRNLKFYTLCGHIHEHWKVQRRMLNVGVDVHNFTPVSLEKVLECVRKEEEGEWDANVY